MYGKIFEQMFDGTLATKGPWQALVTFQQLIILANKDGVIDMTPTAIARRTTIPEEIIVAGIAALEQPDPDSRSPDEGGRRIVRLSDTRTWGWRIVNHAKYRKIRSQDERRDYHAQYYREKRDSKSKTAETHNTTQHNSTDSTHSTESTDSTNCSKQKAESSKPPIAPPQEGGPPKAKRSRMRLPVTSCPAEFNVSPAMVDWAEQQGMPNDRVMRETGKFLDHWRGKGELRADWTASWRTWIRNAVDFGLERGSRQRGLA